MKLSNNLYNIIKWLCVLGIPVASWAYVELAKVWGLPMAEQISQTLKIVTFAMGAWMGISSKAYWNENEIVPKVPEDEDGE